MGIITNFQVSATNVWYDTVNSLGQIRKVNQWLNFKQVSRSRRFSVAKDLEHIYKYLSHCLREIIRSSPTSSSSKPQDMDEEVATFEEVVQPKYIYEFELVEMRPEEMIDMGEMEI